MKVSVNSQELAKQLQEIKLDTVRRMESMVAGFAQNVARSAVDNTPIGEEGRYDDLYLLREDNLGIEPTPGFHMGAWRYDPDGSLTFDSTIYAPEEAISRALQETTANYTIGETFYIGAKGPAYDDLNNGSSGKAPEGIMKPALDQLMSVYLTDLQKYYRSN